MKYIIQKNAKEPAYLQLYLQLRSDITNGIYPPMHKLPSKRTLSQDVGVSIITVAHAYELLCDEGYVESRERSGYIVIFRANDLFAPDQTNAHIFPANNHIDAGTEFPFSVLAKAMRTVISNMGDSILDRSPNIGTTELRNAIAQYLKRNRGIVADPGQIVIGSGSEHLYNRIVELLGREKVYAIESPSYKKIEQVYIASDVKIAKLKLCADGIDSAELQNCKADILHITPYRSFPSGITASASKRHKYLQWAQSANRLIIEDDFESEFSVSRKAEETLFAHTDQDNVIYMNSFSMTVSPSLRVGYMILPKGLMSEFIAKLGFYSCTVPTYIQFVLAELISSGDFERHINRVRRAKRKELAK